MHLDTNRNCCSYRTWGLLVLTAGMLALGPRVHASAVAPTLTLGGTAIVSVSDTDGQGVTFDLRALSDVYLDLGNLNVPFLDVSLTADQGVMTLHGAEVSDLWPHTAVDAYTVSDTEVVYVSGDSLIQPDAKWAGATFSLLAGGDMHIFGGGLIASGNITMTASDLNLWDGSIIASGSGDPVDTGAAGNITIGSGNPSDVGVGGVVTIGGEVTISMPVVSLPGGNLVVDVGDLIDIVQLGEITLVDGDLTLVPLPGGAWLFGTALLSLAGYARRRRTV